MRFKEGLGWKACYDEENNLYTAKDWDRGDYYLFEIDKEIFDKLDDPHSGHEWSREMTEAADEVFGVNKKEESESK